MFRVLGLGLILLALPSLSLAAAIDGIRSWQLPNATNVVFDLSAPVEYRLLRLRQPERLVIDFLDLDEPSALRLPPVQGSPIQAVRYARRGNGELRVVLDLAESFHAKDLLLPAQKQYGDRLLVTFSPATNHGWQNRAFAHERSPSAANGADDATAARRRSSRNLDQRSDTESYVITRPSFGQRANSFMHKLIAGAGDTSNWEVSGFYSTEARVFLHDAQYPRQHEANASFAIQPELYTEWDGGDQSLLFVPFFRWDQGDPRRTHFDVRELSYIKSSRNWEFRAGVRKIFWGVAESNHLIDVINQFDVVENIDNEDKLGQPMLNLALIQDWGTIDLFALIGFRERTFPGVKGRLRTQFRVDTSNATYDSSAENSHVDWAIRYSHAIGDYDIGLYHFWGTGRDPRFFPRLTSSNELVLAPHYDIIHQTGTDIQATKGNWLFKFEGLRRSGQGDTYYATVGGFEYTFVGIFETAMDLGVLGEYHFDDRGEAALLPFNHDVFSGARLAFNDTQDLAVLAGISSDLNGNSKFFNVEASRRLFEHWKIEAEMRIFWDVERGDPFFFIRGDDYFQVELARYF